MIVNPTQTGWEVIYQPAHALLATTIASHWWEDQRPTRWIETLVALAQHDDETENWTGCDHLTEAGAPLDFALNKNPPCFNHILSPKIYSIKGSGQHS
jgi:hypothetical protein